MPQVARINEFESKIKPLSDEALRSKTGEFKQRIANGETLDALLPEAFAVVREAAWRSIGLRHYDVQMIGGITLHRGRIAEMRTGEGKTLVATLPCYLNALSGKGVHVVTVNDYLARRDAGDMGRVHRFLGLSTRHHRARAHRQSAQNELRLRRHVWNEQRVRLRLPTRQHEVPFGRLRAGASSTLRSSTKSTRS